MDIQTRLVHAGEERINGAVVLPIFQSSTFVSPKEEEYHDIRYLPPQQHAQPPRLARQTGRCLRRRGRLGRWLGNGGDHHRIDDRAQQRRSPADPRLPLRGHAQLCDAGMRRAWGLSYDFIAGNAPETWAAKLRPETRAIYVETMTNPLMEVADLEAGSGILPASTD